MSVPHFGADSGNREEWHLQQALSVVMKEGAGLRAPLLDDVSLFARLRAVCAGFRARPLLTPQELLAHAHGEGCNESFRQAVLEGFLSRDTAFFRDRATFHFLQRWLQERQQEQLPTEVSTHIRLPRPIRVWSATCASGQEPLSLSILWHNLRRSGRSSGMSFEIYASDISSRSLAKARIGRYNNFDAQHGLTVHDLLGFFDEQSGGGFWQAKAFLLEGIRFFEHNLLHSPPPFLPRNLDWIFAPSTFSDFDEFVAERVITRLATLLSPDGWLVLSPCDAELGFRAGFREDILSRRQGLFSRAAFSYPDCLSGQGLLPESSFLSLS